MEPLAAPCLVSLRALKGLQNTTAEGSNCHFNTMFPSAACHCQPVCITANFHMLCETKPGQLMLCSVCSTTFYWKELQSPSGQQQAKDSQHHSLLWHREQLYSLKLQFWENSGFIITLGDVQQKHNVLYTLRGSEQGSPSSAPTDPDHSLVPAPQSSPWNPPAFHAPSK